MKVIETNLLDAYVIKCDVYEDSRGSFMESFNLKKFKKEVSSREDFVQDNHSISKKGVLRGLHYQIEHPQGKLVRCTSGRVLDVLVDLRKSSATFGQHITVLLDEKYKQVWVPPGFAHGFYVLSDKADVVYKITDYYYPQHEKTLVWNDAQLAIDWKIEEEPIISEKDKIGKTFEECEKYD
jgi:dTDP-4-dehydrorhamnose 3,5-epimerase